MAMRGWHLPVTAHLQDLRQGWRYIGLRCFATEVDLGDIVGIYTSQVTLHAHDSIGNKEIFPRDIRGPPQPAARACMLQTKALWMERLRREKARLGVEGSPLAEVVSKAPKRLIVSYPFSTSPLLQEQVWPAHACTARHAVCGASCHCNALSKILRTSCMQDLTVLSCAV